MKKKIAYPAFFRILGSLLFGIGLMVSGVDVAHAQVAPTKSVHQQQAEFYKQLGFQTEAEYDAYNGYNPKNNAHQFLSPQSNCTLTHEVFGYHPYWAGSAYTSYDYSLISTVCYFSYEVNANTGSYNTVHAWKTTPLIQTAHNAGKKVVLCATLFGSTELTTFLSNAAARSRCIDSLVALVQARGADGVNIDFEGVPSGQKANYTAFMNALATKFHAVMPGSQVSHALPAVDWSNAYDVANMPGVDLHIIMGYDFYWTTAANAGPSGLLYPSALWGNYSESRSINDYLNKGVPSNKLIMGVPYYGFDYPTGTSNALHAATTGSGSSVTYAVAKGKAVQYGKQWNDAAPCPYYMYQSSGNWRQAYYEDSLSLSRKYDVIRQRNIGGMGIWALSYDGANTELWGAIRQKFTTCHLTTCNGTFLDQGGPAGNYQNNENWTYTLAPNGAVSVSLSFSSFATEAGKDTLFIYNGTTTNAPLIGAYTGSVNPGTVIGTTGALTFRFKSNGTNTASGWIADWTCSAQLADVISPVTTVGNLPNWVTNDFTVNFTDTDNHAVAQRYYQVQGFDGSRWTGMNAKGFAFDDFSSMSSDWVQASGTWVTNGTLEQTDGNNGNSNIYATIPQSGAYYYSWRAKMGGTGTNRRSGLHFFADNPTATNRGNSYLVWFRIDQAKVELYKIVNDVLNVVHSAPLTTTPDAWYNYAVSFDPTTGKMVAYRDNVVVATWVDNSPFVGGNYVSFRNGNCTITFDDFRVLKGRTAAALVSVGDNQAAGYQSLNPNTTAVKVLGLSQDLAGNLSTLVHKEAKVDWTPPAPIATVNDGPGNDLITTSNISSISGNWMATTDPHSGILYYEYAVGTSPGATDFINWTNNGTATTFTKNDVLLTIGIKYFISVRATNGAGLVSPVQTSNGVLVLVPCNVPSGLTTTSITSNSAYLQWVNVPGANSYTLQYKVGSALNWTTVNVTTNNYTLTGLLPGTVYRWQVQANCTGNQQSGYSASVQFTTTTCTIPISLQALSVSTSTATLRWGAVAGATAYTVQYKVYNASNWTTVTVSSAQLSLSGLSPSTQYVWQVSTICGSAQSGYSTSTTFTTTASCTDANESNNSSTTATILATNGNKFGKLCPSTDVDWFKVTLTSTTNLRVTLSNLPANYNLELYIGGTFVSGSYNSGTTNEVITRNNQPAGTLYYRIYGVSGATNSLVDYLITAQTSTTPFRLEESEELAQNNVSLPIQVYPNPFVGAFKIDLDLQQASDLELQMLDMTGSEVYRQEIEELLPGKQTLNINIPNLAQGVYLLKVRAGNIIKTTRVVHTR